MVTLEADFQKKLREALLAEVERVLVGERGDVVFQAIQASHDRLDASGYDVASVKESLIAPTLETTADGRVAVTWGWTHPAAEFFEFGTSEHTIQGDPVLSFVWEDPPAWVKDEFDQARDTGGRFASGWRVFFAQVTVDGVDEVRFTRHGLRVLRSELEAV
jgi:hypothetical protein